MGSKLSNHSCSLKCKCFDHDSKIHQGHSIRYATRKWQWNDRHQQALKECISEISTVYNLKIPKEIAQLIKDHTYHYSEAYYITYPVIQNVKYYHKSKHLLQKELCRVWYMQKSHLIAQSLLIAVHITNKQSGQHILSSVNKEALPALQLHSTSLYMDKYQQIQKTVHVNQCQVGLHLIMLENGGIYQHQKHTDDVLMRPQMHVIVLNESDSLNSVNICCHKIWKETQSMDNVFILELRSSKKGNYRNQPNHRHHRHPHRRSKQAINELARYWNIPWIPLILDEAQSINEFFNFLVKYYWFCDVIR